MPEHWRVKRAKYLFSLAQRPPRETDGIVTAFRDGEVTLRSNRRTDGFTNATKEAGYQGVRKGDLVIHAMDAFAGAIGVSDSDGKCTPVYSCCVPNKLATSEFYSRCVRTMSTTGYIASLAKGIRERSTDFRWATFAEQSLPLPPRDEQDAIVSYLDRATTRIDTLVAKKTRFIELLREKRQALITHAVTKGLDAGVPMKDSGVEWLGEVPEHWLPSKIKYLISSIEQGWSPQCDSFPADASQWGVLKVGCVNGGEFNPQQNKALPASLEPAPSLSLRRGDVLISRANTRELVGSCAVVQHDYPTLILCDKLYRLRPSPAISGELLSRMIHVYGRRDIETEASGASSSMVNIAQSTIREMMVFVPPRREQETIVDSIVQSTSRIDTLIAKTERSIELLREKRTALITAAVTGKIDLRNAA